MKNALLAFIMLALPLAGFAKGKAHSHAHESFKLIHVADLASWMDAQDPKLAIYDVNMEKIRKADGIIPGAKLLSTSNKYPATELPPNKDAKLVFYCANTKCTASHNAAKRAHELGYEDVNVMTEGIKGWVDAGKPTTKL